jgi:hypothetical protein
MLDMMRPGSGFGAGAGRLAAMQIRQRSDRVRRQLDRSYREAMARALKETSERKVIAMPKASISVDWNRLASQLGNDLQQGRDKAPPERYRRAIELYFDEISKAATEMHQSPQ